MGGGTPSPLASALRLESEPLGGGSDTGDTGDPSGCRTHDRRGREGTLGSRFQLHRQKGWPRAMAPQRRKVLKAKVVSIPWLGVIKWRPARRAVKHAQGECLSPEHLGPASLPSNRGILKSSHSQQVGDSHRSHRAACCWKRALNSEEHAEGKC